MSPTCDVPIPARPVCQRGLWVAQSTISVSFSLFSWLPPTLNLELPCRFALLPLGQVCFTDEAHCGEKNPFPVSSLKNHRTAMSVIFVAFLVDTFLSDGRSVSKSFESFST